MYAYLYMYCGRVYYIYTYYTTIYIYIHAVQRYEHLHPTKKKTLPEAIVSDCCGGSMPGKSTGPQVHGSFSSKRPFGSCQSEHILWGFSVESVD